MKDVKTIVAQFADIMGLSIDDNYKKYNVCVVILDNDMSPWLKKSRYYSGFGYNVASAYNNLLEDIMQQHHWSTIEEMQIWLDMQNIAQ